MPTTKIRTALAVGATTLGVIISAVPAQAAAPARPPGLRLQGASTTVTVFRPAGTRNVYLRATTIKRTLNGTIARAVNRIPIRWTVTKPVILDGKVVAKVSAGATGQGASEAECKGFAMLINGWNMQAVAAIADGDFGAAADSLLNEAQEIDAALDAGCFVIL